MNGLSADRVRAWGRQGESWTLWRTGTGLFREWGFFNDDMSTAHEIYIDWEVNKNILILQGRRWNKTVGCLNYGSIGNSSCIRQTGRQTTWQISPRHLVSRSSSQFPPAQTADRNGNLSGEYCTCCSEFCAPVRFKISHRPSTPQNFLPFEQATLTDIHHLFGTCHTAVSIAVTGHHSSHSASLVIICRKNISRSRHFVTSTFLRIYCKLHYWKKTLLQSAPQKCSVQLLRLANDGM
jgi:hypothetical protein